MITKLNIILILNFLIQASIYAGNEVGNGGDALVCKKEQSLSVRLLDYSEGEVNSNKSDSQEKYRKLLHSWIKKFKALDPKLSSMLSRKTLTIDQDFTFKKGIQLIDIKDSKHIYIPQNCVLKQLAIRRFKKIGGEKFVVNQDYWEKLSEEDKAGLVLHELLYEYFYYLGVRDSKEVRELNRIIYNYAHGSEITKSEYKQRIRNLELPHYP